MTGERRDFDVHHGREPAEPLRADAERVDLVISSTRNSSSGVAGPRASSSDMSIGLSRASLARSMAFSALPPIPSAINPGRAPSGAEGGKRLEYPVNHRFRGVQANEFGLIFRPAALGSQADSQSVARNDLGMNHGRRVVARVLSAKQRIGDHRRAKRVCGVGVGAAHAFIDQIGKAAAASSMIRSCPPWRRRQPRRYPGTSAVFQGGHARVGRGSGR